MTRPLTAEKPRTYREEARGIALFLIVICAVFTADLFFPLEQAGLIPRTLRGLLGIIAMPFLHANVSHLLSNIVPLTVLLALLARSQAHSTRVVVLIILFSGLLLWMFGRTASHIGASSLVFGLCAFLLTAGALERSLSSIVVAAFVLFLYGGNLISGMLPTQSSISWDGHAFGALAGLAIAMAMFRRTPDNQRS